MDQRNETEINQNLNTNADNGLDSAYLYIIVIFLFISLKCFSWLLSSLYGGEGTFSIELKTVGILILILFTLGCFGGLIPQILKVEHPPEKDVIIFGSLFGVLFFISMQSASCMPGLIFSLFPQVISLIPVLFGFKFASTFGKS